LLFVCAIIIYYCSIDLERLSDQIDETHANMKAAAQLHRRGKEISIELEAERALLGSNVHQMRLVMANISGWAMTNADAAAPLLASRNKLSLAIADDLNLISNYTQRIEQMKVFHAEEEKQQTFIKGHTSLLFAEFGYLLGPVLLCGTLFLFLTEGIIRPRAPRLRLHKHRGLYRRGAKILIRCSVLALTYRLLTLFAQLCAKKPKIGIAILSQFREPAQVLVLHDRLYEQLNIAWQDFHAFDIRFKENVNASKAPSFVRVWTAFCEMTFVRIEHEFREAYYNPTIIAAILCLLGLGLSQVDPGFALLGAGLIGVGTSLFAWLATYRYEHRRRKSQLRELILYSSQKMNHWDVTTSLLNEYGREIDAVASVNIIKATSRVSRLVNDGQNEAARRVVVGLLRRWR
jgi:hypothetical protein